MKNKKVGICIWCLLFVLVCAVQAQKTNLQIISLDDAATKLSTLKLKTSFTNTSSCLSYVQQLPGYLQSLGYLAASIDSVAQEQQEVKIWLFIGEQYRWRKLWIQAADWPLLRQFNFSPQQFSNQPFNQRLMVQLQEKLLQYFEQNGYPFAAISFDSVQLQQKEVAARLKIDKGILYKLDSIRLIGNAKISKDFLHRYLNLPAQAVYNTQVLQGIQQKLQELPYVQQTEPWRIAMLGNAYLVDLYLNNKRSNQVDALVGFLPANQQLGGKLLFTVDAKLKLQNAFATGETIALNWQQIQPESPRLNLFFQKPFIFKSGFGVDVNFDLFKKDSSFLNLNSTVGVQYNLSAKQYMKVLLQSFRTNLLDVDTNAIKVSKQLPDIIDVSINSLAVEYDMNATNYRFNPSKGWSCNVQLSTGLKKIRQNNSITQIKDPNYDYSKLYNNIPTNTYAIRVKANAAKYFPLSRYAVFKAAGNIGMINSPQIFRNEMFQIGGYRLLRGFDEESIYTSQYGVATLEYRYLIGLNAYFSVFSDIGIANNTLIQQSYNYLGLGAGMAFETKQGIFNLMLASGKRNDLPFNLRQLKIHIGYVSLF